MDELVIRAIQADRHREAEVARLAASFRQDRPRRPHLRELLRKLRWRQGPPRASNGYESLRPPSGAVLAAKGREG